MMVDIVLHAFQCTHAFFLHGADKVNVSLGFNTGMVKRTDRGQYGCASSGVIRNTRAVDPSVFPSDLQFCFQREYGVHMSFHKRCLTAAGSSADTDRIAVFINVAVFKSFFPEHFQKSCGFLLLVECRRRNQGQFNLFLNNVFLIFLHELQRLLNLFIRCKSVQCIRYFFRYFVLHSSSCCYSISPYSLRAFSDRI